MISYQIIEHGKPLQKVLHETPKPQGSEVLMRITRSGVCHSDLHIWDGYFDLGGGKRFYVKERGCVPPFTLGPRAVRRRGSARAESERREGRAEAARSIPGSAAASARCAKPARTTTASRARASSASTAPAPTPPTCWCPTRSTCSTPPASTTPSPPRSPAPASPPTARAPSCPPLGPKDRVAVIGCGGLGLIGISVLRAKGVKNIVACDIDDAKLAARDASSARSSTVNTRAPDAAQQLAGHRRRRSTSSAARRPRRSASPRCARAGATCWCGLLRRRARASAAADRAARHRHRRLLRRQPAGAEGSRGAGEEEQAQADAGRDAPGRAK